MTRSLTALLVTASLTAIAGAARAEPLTLAELYQLESYLSCTEDCEYGRAAERAACLGDCGAASADWDKNADGSVDVIDHRLAYLEFWDDGTGTQICYERGAVVPLPACGLEDCLATRGEAECADADADGLRAFQEELLGTSDSDAQSACAQDRDCGGFDAHCTYVDMVNRTLCMPRECGEDDCTAFHLETVILDHDELIVTVHFDYSPVAPTVLDLRLEYTDGMLQLLDARPLAALTRAGKALQVRHPAAGQIRLIAIGSVTARPIEPGPIAELVFRRSGPSGATVSFTDNDYAQERSMAPSPGATREELRDDALWGAEVTVSARAADDPRLVLHYSFDNPSTPLDLNRAKSGAALCDLSSDCRTLDPAVPAQAQPRQRLIAQFDALQRGAVFTAGPIEGVAGPGVFLDGYANHLELPVAVHDPPAGLPYRAIDQSFTVSAWVYDDGDAQRGIDADGSVIFSHNTSSERTRLGLVALPGGDGASFQLAFFEGDLSDPGVSKTIVASALPSRTWTHLALAVDAAARTAAIFINGVAAGAAIPLSGLVGASCPVLEPPPTVGLQPPIMGSAPGTIASQAVYYASAVNNLHGIERIDPNGLARTTILRDPDSSAITPDYSPTLDRLVFASSASGSYEIWIANGDGSGRRQVTRGFGDTERGIFSRRPTWAPDGSGIVFESNVYDLAANDNAFGRGYHLYYIAYDGIANQVAIPTATGETVRDLDYRTLLDAQTVNDYRLTRAATRNHMRVAWLRGKHESVGQQYLGELLLTTADQRLENRELAHVRIAEPINNVTPEPISARLPNPERGGEIQLLAATRRQPAGSPEEVLALIERAWVSYEAADLIELEIESIDGHQVAVARYAPPTPEESCWDLDVDEVCDPAEDRNRDTTCDAADCLDQTLSDIYIRFNPEAVAPVANHEGGIAATPGAWIDANKRLRAARAETSNGSYVKLDIASPINNLPIPFGAELARVPFRQHGTGDTGLSAMTRRVRQELYLQRNDEPAESVVMERHQVQELLDARFAPDGSRLLLAGIQNARPVLMTTDGLTGTAGAQTISTQPMGVRGLSWTAVTQRAPCQWIGGVRDPRSGLYRRGFRGGLDELKVHDYLRPEGAILSEAARGRERLNADGRAGALSGGDRTCASDLDCPSYQLCGDDFQCAAVTCDPFVPDDCGTGQCTLVPVPVSLDDDELRWVCTVECENDRQCFEQECQNGPCRFCSDATDTCQECQLAIQDFGDFSIESIEGCPDRNRFACEEGSCVTECYAIEDGESRYLCDSATEYCRQGRCALFDWDWVDIAPATFAGLGEARFDLPELEVTRAITQLYPVEITAFGVEDYLHPPEVLIQGRVTHPAGAAVYGGSWFDLGRILVHHKTEVEAMGKPYVVYSPYPITGLRLRLINPPYENLNAAATGLPDKDGEFCGAKAWSEENPEACYRRANGSRANLGYRIGIPALAARRACAAAIAQELRPPTGRDGDLIDCGATGGDYQEYLFGGQPTAVVLEVKVDGTSVLGNVARNTICSYEGTATPYDGLRARRLYFGDPSTEQSWQKDLFYPEPTGPGLLDISADTGGSWALLNCPYAVPGEPDQVAALDLDVPLDYPRPSAGIVERPITETAHSCLVEVIEASGPTSVPCYEWVGGPTLDPMSGAPRKNRTLDYGPFTSFGYDAP